MSCVTLHFNLFIKIRKIFTNAYVVALVSILRVYQRHSSVYLLSMKGMFTRTNPQLVFLFKLLQAHCTYLKREREKRQTMSLKRHAATTDMMVILWVLVLFILISVLCQWTGNEPLRRQMCGSQGNKNSCGQNHHNKNTELKKNTPVKSEASYVHLYNSSGKQCSSI